MLKNCEEFRSGAELQLSIHHNHALSRWCRTNGIQMNVDKTKLMMFGNQKKIDQLPKFEIKVENLPLSVTPSYKYLGITLDSQLNYNTYVQQVITSVANKLRQFRRMRFFLDTKAATLIYKNMILPVLEYGDIFMVSTSVENRKRLQILQNKGLRCALNKDRTTSREELHTEADLLQLKQRRDIHMLSYMYEMYLVQVKILSNLERKGSELDHIIRNCLNLGGPKLRNTREVWPIKAHIGGTVYQVICTIYLQGHSLHIDFNYI